MASMPINNEGDSASPSRPSSERRTSDPPHAPSHKARFRASLAWALDEYKRTLAKLAK
jgi:hypothetical protein